MEGRPPLPPHLLRAAPTMLLEDAVEGGEGSKGSECSEDAHEAGQGSSEVAADSRAGSQQLELERSQLYG